MASINNTTIPLIHTSFQQKATMGNATATVCEPIAWTDILKHPEARFNPKNVRRYLKNIVEKMNHHLGIWMDGPNICKLRIRRKIRNITTGAQYVDVSVSLSRAKALFPWKVECRWIEKNQQKNIFRNVVDIFLLARNRNEIYHQPESFGVPLRYSPTIEWLKTQLALSSECCTLNWGGLNSREMLYSSFLEDVKFPENWHPKKISQEIYSVLPSCRPASRKRVRTKGVNAMFLPPREDCKFVLDRWVQMYEGSNRLTF